MFGSLRKRIELKLAAFVIPKLIKVSNQVCQSSFVIRVKKNKSMLKSIKNSRSAI